jgi:hypothetical protein
MPSPLLKSISIVQLQIIIDASLHVVLYKRASVYLQLGCDPLEDWLCVTYASLYMTSYEISAARDISSAFPLLLSPNVKFVIALCKNAVYFNTYYKQRYFFPR